MAPAAGAAARHASVFACLSVAAAEAAGPGALATLAETFSPRYEHLRPGLTVVDLRGVDRLFGTPRAVGEAIQREAATRRVPVHVAIAPTQVAAVVMAVSRPGLSVVPSGMEASSLAVLPIETLLRIGPVHLAPEAGGRARPGVRTAAAPDAAAAVALFTRWGLRTLGELGALPAAELAARLGAAGRVWQQVARGTDWRPLVPSRADERFEAAMELEWPIEGQDPLSFVLTRLLEPLSTRLERADRGAARLHLQLRLITRDDHVRVIELPAPLREVRALRTLLLLDLEGHPPPAAIDRVTLTIDPTPGRILQHTLFARPYPTPEQLSTLLARLGALFGQHRIGAAGAADSHRPGAFTMKPFAPPAEPPPAMPAPATRHMRPLPAGPADETPDTLVAALRRYRHPVPARVVRDGEGRPVRVTTDRRGLSGGTVLSCAGPWRTSGEWWDRAPAPGALRPEPRFGLADPRVPQEPARAVPASPGPPSALPVSAGRSPSVSPTSAALAPVSTSFPADASAPGQAAGWDRDEWDVALSDGVIYRVFHDRTTQAWFIDAVAD